MLVGHTFTAVGNQKTLLVCCCRNTSISLSSWRGTHGSQTPPPPKTALNFKLPHSHPPTRLAPAGRRRRGRREGRETDVTVADAEVKKWQKMYSCNFGRGNPWCLMRHDTKLSLLPPPPPLPSQKKSNRKKERGGRKKICQFPKANKTEGGKEGERKSNISDYTAD